MDAVLLQNTFTLVSAAAFAGIVAWAWSRSVRSDFAQAERIPFEEDRPAGNGRRA
jgi:cbb3-type cytochrome oxidase subunit 3